MALDRKRSFPPIVDENTRVLILGSLPGEASLAAGQYYAHPRNGFWRLVGHVVEEDLAALPYPERLAALKRQGIGLWDVVEEAHRKGSLDSAILDATENDLEALVKSLPNLRAVAFNGGTSTKVGTRRLAHLPHLTLIRLPSSSPAYAGRTELKRQAWAALRAYLDPHADRPREGGDPS